MANRKNPILFNRPAEGGFWLTNFQKGYPLVSKLPTKITSSGEIASDSKFIEIGGKEEFTWYSSEHLFQALKFTRDNINTELIKKIINVSEPADAQKLGRPIGRSDWIEPTNYRLHVMRWVLKQKFNQHVTLKKMLIDTDDALLVENAGPRDPFWGNGAFGSIDKSSGQNKLGELLMELRTQLQAETGRTPPTPPSTPPYTPPSSPTPNNGRKLDNTEIHDFETKIETELRSKGITTNDLSSKYQGWFNYIGANEWKTGKLDNYENDLKEEIKRVANKKNQPSSPPAPTLPTPKASQNYRDKWVRYLEKEFQELDFGDQYDTIVRKLSEIKNKIKDDKFDTEEKVENLGREFLDILKKFGKKKSESNPTNNPSLPPTELTPEEKKTLSNQLENLSQKTPEDLGKKDEKPVEISAIKKYFQANNNIKSITLEDNGELTIEFQDKTTQTTLANNEQLQQVKKYLQQKNEKSLNREKLLNISQNSHPDKVNYLVRVLVGGGLAILVIFFALIIFRQRRIRKRK